MDEKIEQILGKLHLNLALPEGQNMRGLVRGIMELRDMNVTYNTTHNTEEYKAQIINTKNQIMREYKLNTEEFKAIYQDVLDACL